MPGIAPAPDNGWNERLHLAVQRQGEAGSIPAAVDRAEFNGFATYITAHSTYKVGVYSSAPIWSVHLRHRHCTRSIPNTYEWTYLPETSTCRASRLAAGACRRHRHVRAVLRRPVVVEQVRPDVAVVGRRRLSNGYGDFDQIDVARMK